MKKLNINTIKATTNTEEEALTLEFVKAFGHTYFLDAANEYLLNQLDLGGKHKVQNITYLNSHNAVAHFEKLISTQFGCSKEQAFAWLMYKDEVDLIWIEENLTQEELELIYSYNPFSSFPQHIKKWVDFGRPTSLKRWVYICREANHCNSAEEFRKLLHIDKFFDFTPIYRVPGWKNLSVSEILAEFYEIPLALAQKCKNSKVAEVVSEFKGEIRSELWNGSTTVGSLLHAGASYETLVRGFSAHSWLAAYPKYARLLAQKASHDLIKDGAITLVSKPAEARNPKGLDHNYWNWKNDNQSLLKAGVDPEWLFSYRLDWGVSTEGYPLTRKEKIRILSQTYCKIGYEDVVPRAQGNKIPESECKTLLVWAWSQAHPEWTEKVRVVHGPAGQVYNLHHHLLVREMDNDLLPQGVKTSPRRIEEALLARANESIEKSLGVYRQLPALKLDATLPGEIKQLTSSWDLRDEGKKMSHCVGGYVESCLQEQSFIFHVDDGTELGATVEVSPNPWRVVQSMNHGNSHSPVAQQLVEQHVLPFIKKEV